MLKWLCDLFDTSRFCPRRGLTDEDIAKLTPEQQQKIKEIRERPIRQENKDDDTVADRLNQMGYWQWM